MSENTLATVNFNQIIFDVLLGINRIVLVEFSSVKNRIEYYHKLQDSEYENQLDFYTSNLDSLSICNIGYTGGYFTNIIYHQVNNSDEFILERWYIKVDINNTITFEQILFDMVLGIRRCVRIKFADRTDINRFLLIVFKAEYADIIPFIDNTTLNLSINGLKLTFGENYLHVKDNEFIRI